jgi:D-lactate dehydrogenase (cytochrome)
LIFMVDTADEAEMTAVKAANARLVQRALKFGGTCTGEHGVGLGKLPYLREEHGESLDVMRAIKRALDPHDIMNPGKLIPPPQLDHEGHEGHEGHDGHEGLI